MELVYTTEHSVRFNDGQSDADRSSLSGVDRCFWRSFLCTHQLPPATKDLGVEAETQTVRLI